MAEFMLRVGMIALKSWAKPGVRCICVDDSRRTFMLSGEPVVMDGVYPVAGEVYTVRLVEWYESPYPEITPSFLGAHLLEISRPASLMTGDVVPYDLNRFRPLVENKAERDQKALVPA